MVVDEIDKASADGHYDPLGALYELLESETATHFVDEFVELPIDASGAVWLATANDAARIPEPLLSRMACTKSRRRMRKARRALRSTIYARSATRTTGAGSSPRRCRKRRSTSLLRCRRAKCAARSSPAFGNAKIAGRSEVGPRRHPGPAQRRDSASGSRGRSKCKPAFARRRLRTPRSAATTRPTRARRRRRQLAHLFDIPDSDARKHADMEQPRRSCPRRGSGTSSTRTRGWR